MLIWFGLIALVITGCLAVKLYQRHLDAQIGPWMTELAPQRTRPMRQRIDGRNR